MEFMRMSSKEFRERFVEKKPAKNTGYLSRLPENTGNKYHATKVELNGIKFDSKKESKRYILLKSLEDEGIIKDLECQKRFLLQETFKYRGNTVKSIHYIADFVYFDKRTDEWVAEDVKSAITRRDKVYSVKKKLFMYKYPEWRFDEVI